MTLEDTLLEMFYALEADDYETYERLRKTVLRQIKLKKKKPVSIQKEVLH